MRWLLLFRSGIQARIGLLRIYIYICLVGLLLVLFRQFIPTDKPFLFLFWNLFLALIPLGLSTILLEANKTKESVLSRVLLFFLWLIFFPNAPYMMTDYIHLMYGDKHYFLLDFFTLTYFIITAFVTAIISLKDIAEYLSKKIGVELVHLSVLGICLLSGLGIYLGRDLRFNSWDLVLKPQEIVQLSMARLSDPMSDLYTWLAATIISLLLFVAYWFWPKKLLAIEKSA